MYEINETNGFKEYGWICPKCGGVMSPKQTTCIYCMPNNTTTIYPINADQYIKNDYLKTISNDTEKSIH